MITETRTIVATGRRYAPVMSDFDASAFQALIKATAFTGMENATGGAPREGFIALNFIPKADGSVMYAFGNRYSNANQQNLAVWREADGRMTFRGGAYNVKKVDITTNDVAAINVKHSLLISFDTTTAGTTDLVHMWLDGVYGFTTTTFLNGEIDWDGAGTNGPAFTVGCINQNSATVRKDWWDGCLGSIVIQPEYLAITNDAAGQAIVDTILDPLDPTRFLDPGVNCVNWGLSSAIVQLNNDFAIGLENNNGTGGDLTVDTTALAKCS
jgi:hypothetical protein